MTTQEQAVLDHVFVGLNRRVIALDRYSGAIDWDWKSPKGAGFVTVLLDGDRLITAVAGYVYCLDPATGEVVWDNPLKGFGNGFSCLASARGHTTTDGPAALMARQRSSATSSTSAGVSST